MGGERARGRSRGGRDTGRIHRSGRMADHRDNGIGGRLARGWLAVRGLWSAAWLLFDNQSRVAFVAAKATGAGPMACARRKSRFDVLLRAGGRGFIRPPSLISVWSTAPFLQNNSVGKFNPYGTVAGRLESFDDSIHKLLWPEKRTPLQGFLPGQKRSQTPPTSTRDY